jgi:hypothetical protein
VTRAVLSGGKSSLPFTSGFTSCDPLRPISSSTSSAGGVFASHALIGCESFVPGAYWWKM